MRPVQRGFRIGGLGEIAIRCADLVAMTAFYRDIIGLEPLGENAERRIVFLKVADGYRGHTAIVALFADDGFAPGSPSSLHHLALSTGHDEQDAALAWFTAHGLEPRVEHFDWIGWRGVFVHDPEGNVVEIVAKIPTGQSTFVTT